MYNVQLQHTDIRFQFSMFEQLAADIPNIQIPNSPEKCVIAERVQAIKHFQSDFCSLSRDGINLLKYQPDFSFLI